MDQQKPIFLTDPEGLQNQENAYLEVRRREGRVFDDETVRMLPNISKSNTYAKEWRWRKQTFQGLKQYLLSQKKDKARILDLGCGNGWMSNRLAENPQWEVVGIDINRQELEQAARLFGRKNLQFFYADVPGLGLNGLQALGSFEYIVMAAALQYFPNLEALVSTLKTLLSPQGEVHIVDTRFYRGEAAVAAARQRTLDYYRGFGVPEMAAYYHHHRWEEIERLGGEDLLAGIWQKLRQKAGAIAPFPWVRMRFP